MGFQNLNKYVVLRWSRIVLMNNRKTQSIIFIIHFIFFSKENIECTYIVDVPIYMVKFIILLSKNYIKGYNIQNTRNNFCEITYSNIVCK